MKIKSIVATIMIAASGFYASASFAQIPSLPVVGSLTGAGIPDLGGLGGGIPSLGLLGGIPSLDGIVDVAALPGVVPGLIEAIPRSLGNNAAAVPGLIAMGAALEPLDTLDTGIGIGSSLGAGAVFSTVPVSGVATSDPMNVSNYLLDGGSILTQSGIIGTLPAIPLVNAPLGLGL